MYMYVFRIIHVHVPYIYMCMFWLYMYTCIQDVPLNSFLESLHVRVVGLHELIFVDTTAQTQVVWNMVLLSLQNLKV